MDYNKVLRSFTEWAEGNDNIRSVILTGSAAAAAAHPLSDRDIELHVRNPEILEHDDSWWAKLGEVLVVERLKNEIGQPTRLIYYTGGKLDFTLIAVNEERGVYERPFEILLDKDDDAADFRMSTKIPCWPDQEEFDECVNWGYAAALMMAKAIIRDEPWSLKLRDSDMKAEILRVIEWDHIIRYSGNRDVRYLGTRMRQWMDTDIQAQLEQCWAPFDLSKSRKALEASLALFSRIASRVANAQGLVDFHHEAVHSEIQRILATAQTMRHH